HLGFQWRKYYRKLDPEVKINIRVPIREPEWRWLNTRLQMNHSDVPSRAQFAWSLSSVKNIWIRGKFHTDQIEGRLWAVSLGIATGAQNYSHYRMLSPANPPPQARATEQCDCPYPFDGLS